MYSFIHSFIHEMLQQHHSSQTSHSLSSPRARRRVRVCVRVIILFMYIYICVLQVAHGGHKTDLRSRDHVRMDRWQKRLSPAGQLPLVIGLVSRRTEGHTERERALLLRPCESVVLCCCVSGGPDTLRRRNYS